RCKLRTAGRSWTICRHWTRSPATRRPGVWRLTLPTGARVWQLWAPGSPRDEHTGSSSGSPPQPSTRTTDQVSSASTTGAVAAADRAGGRGCGSSRVSGRHVIKLREGVGPSVRAERRASQVRGVGGDRQAPTTRCPTAVRMCDRRNAPDRRGGLQALLWSQPAGLPHPAAAALPLLAAILRRATIVLDELSDAVPSDAERDIALPSALVQRRERGAQLRHADYLHNQPLLKLTCWGVIRRSFPCLSTARP